MASLSDFFRSKPAAQRWMIGAVALSFVSQFFLYVNDGSIAVLNDTVDISYVNPITVFDPGSVGSGWQLHPQAYVLLVVLAFLFLRDDFAESRWFARLGYWLGALGLFCCAVPAAPFRDAPGALLGLVAVVVGIFAAILNGRAVKATKPPA